MTRILKGIWVVLALILILPFAFLGGGEEVKTNAEEIAHYIKHTVKVKEDGKVSASLIFSTEFPNTYNLIDVNHFKIELKALLDQDLAERKQQIINKFLEENKEEYDPAKKIVFGDQGKAVKGDGYVGYAIEYSSIDVYKYYNNLQTSYKKGFLIDNSKLILDNPFNDIYENASVTTTQADKYKSIYVKASETAGMEDYVTTNYSPDYYNDYMTKSRRTKSTAQTIVEDGEGYYHHIWISDGVNLHSDDEMELSLNIIHAGWWYLFGIGIPLVVMGFAIVAVVITNKYKNKKQEKLQDLNENY